MIKAIIIDDEESARNVLESILKEYCKEVEVLGTFQDVPSGVVGINQLSPDLVFLDVEMPNYSGFELLDFFQEINFEIVFATAYSEYAIKAFEVSAVDYLLKPLQIDKVEVAVEKAKEQIAQKKQGIRFKTLQKNLSSNEFQKIALPVADGLEFINIDDLVCVMADGSYSEVHLNDQSRFVISRRIKYFEDILSQNVSFFRPHRSYLINLRYIKKYNKSDASILMENGSTVYLSRDNKSVFEDLIRDMKLV